MGLAHNKITARRGAILIQPIRNKDRVNPRAGRGAAVSAATAATAATAAAAAIAAHFKVPSHRCSPRLISIKLGEPEERTP
jgi:hypothetical protein